MRKIFDDVDVMADLSAATAATIEQLREAFRVRKLFEISNPDFNEYRDWIVPQFKTKES